MRIGRGSLLCGALFLVAGFFIFVSPGFCNSFDFDNPFDFSEANTPIVPAHKFLLDFENQYNQNFLYTHHPFSSYDKITANRSYDDAGGYLKFSPSTELELGYGFKNVFTTGFQQHINSVSGTSDVTDGIDLDRFQDNRFGFRKKIGSYEIYSQNLVRSERAHWDETSQSSSSYYFNNVYVDYSDWRGGLRYSSAENETKKSKTNLSLLRGTQLSAGEFFSETELEYRKGKLYRDAASDTQEHYDQDLTPHYTPRVRMAYGLNDALELQGGFNYTTDLDYKYTLTYITAGSSVFGKYRLSDHFEVPLGVRFRPRENLEMSLTSSMRYLAQRTDYGDPAPHTGKKLEYYNVTPVLRLSYLSEAGRKIQEDDFSALTKYFLERRQWLLDLAYQRDFTHLNKSSADGTQNIIDPYGAFMYPTDHFMTGTEYAALFSGGNSYYFPNIQPQNYDAYQMDLGYGFTDRVNLGAGIGYHSGSAAHQFVLPTASDQLFTFKPYYFSSCSLDFKISHNTLLSLQGYYVPEYRMVNTYTSGGYKESHSKSEEFYVSADLKALF